MATVKLPDSSGARWWKAGLLLAGAVITLFVIAVALVSAIWTPYDVTKLVIADRLQGLSSTHLLGTDHFGRDSFSRALYGARMTVLIGLGAVTVALLTST